MATKETFEIFIANIPYTFSRFFNQHNELLYEVTHLPGTDKASLILVKRNPANDMWEIADQVLAERFKLLAVVVHKIIVNNES